jgi:hypothetical protein
MLIYSTHNLKKLIANVSQRKVLILGSGPSARDVDWEHIDYDRIISTSFFYLNENVSKKPICHISLSKLVDLENENLLSFLRKNKNCTISFEPKISKYLKNKNGQSEKEVIDFVKKTHKFYQTKAFNNFFKEFSDRIFFYRAEGGLEGLAGRIFWPIIKGKPSTVYFCGLDGVSKNPSSDPPNYFREHKGTTDKHYTYEEYKKSFENYAKRMYNASIEHGVQAVNLGKGKNYNLMTTVSVKYEKSEKEDEN